MRNQGKGAGVGGKAGEPQGGGAPDSAFQLKTGIPFKVTGCNIEDQVMNSWPAFLFWASFKISAHILFKSTEQKFHHRFRNFKSLDKHFIIAPNFLNPQEKT